MKKSTELRNHDRDSSERTSSRTNQELWRSLEQCADDGAFRRLVQEEAPRFASALPVDLDRRDFMKLMAASLALAGLGACTSEPEEKIVPYVRQPENFVPGVPQYFATASLLGGYARGVLAESHMGRPTKIEGNPAHPDSLGATDALAQASVLTLYDPDRAQVVSYGARINTWNDFIAALSPRLEAQRLARGAGLRVLTPTVTSPTLGDQLTRLLEDFPEARWHQYEPLMRDNVREGTRIAFGQSVEPVYDFSRADVVLALDSDFLFNLPGSVRYTHDFISRRRVRSSEQSMNRLYAVEGTPSITGAMADHRLPVPSQSIGGFAAALAGVLGVATAEAETNRNGHADRAWIDALARDLEAHRGSSLVVVGDQQPPEVHAIAHAINSALGNVGHTVSYIDPPVMEDVNQASSLAALAGDMANGRVDLLLILGGNPVYDAPADLEFGKQLTKVELRIHSSLFKDETAALCHWHIPATHELETWSDAKAFDGTTTILQPLIAPLYNGKSNHEIMAAFLGEGNRTGHEIVRAYWRKRSQAEDFDSFWHQALHNGVVEGTRSDAREVALNPVDSWLEPKSLQSQPGLHAVFTRDPYVYDGRFSNNAWLQELPKPLTKIVWDNAALVSPATAKALGIESEDVVELEFRGRKVEAPVWIMPGHADELVTVPLGYGRTRGGGVGENVGFDAYAIRTSDALWIGSGLAVHKTGRRHVVARTETHHDMEGRPLVLSGTLTEFQEHPDFVHEKIHEPHASLYPSYEHDGYAWGMSIDLNTCIGCNACVAACQSENNIPVVGKEQVVAGREMHWLRVDRYYKGDAANPETLHQPVPCMHCENAPCEPVCPVGATVHSAEGLNDMVYNRCVGTRYCSNNCPYKVRRFNYFQYADFETPSLKPLRNPDVTVRSRGVMEKCTYCVQRISHARIRAEKENRKIEDGELQTACQQVCPADAIVFGNINDSNSKVAELKREPLDYSLLAELNTRPRTTYLAKLRNPNPKIG